MDFEGTSEIMSFYADTEASVPVEKWNLAGVDVWPVLKNAFYFRVFRPEGYTSAGKKQGWLSKKLENVQATLKAQRLYRSISFKQSNSVFVGDLNHRIEIEGSSLNRYFDPMIDLLENRGERANLLEYGSSTSTKLYKSERVFYLKELLPVFLKKKRAPVNWDELDQAPGCREFMTTFEKKYGLNVGKSRQVLIDTVQNILAWEELFLFLLKQIGARYAFCLCYYTEACYGLILACRKLNIISIDMQHGSQGVLHTAYHFKNYPVNGFNTVPDRFWVWDQSAYSDLQLWLKDKDEASVLGGNPWQTYATKYFDVSEGQVPDDKPLILVSVQTLSPCLDDSILEGIKQTANEYNWWLRLHPRMTTEEFMVFESDLKRFDILDKVEMKKATELPLPYLLKKCQIHISRHSGTISESLYHNIPTLIIDKFGAETYDINDYEDGLINYALADSTDEFVSVIFRMLNYSKNHGIKNGSDNIKRFEEALLSL